MTPDWRTLCADILSDVFEERENQVERFGEAHEASLKDGTGPEVQWLYDYGQGAGLHTYTATEIERYFRQEYEAFERDTEGPPDWMRLVREEVGEAFAEDDPERLEAELLQVASLCVSWIAQLRTR